MRLRNIPGAAEAVENSPYCVNDPEAHKGSWSRDFFDNKPLRIEIGMGKGRFIVSMAQRDRDYGYIGLERYSSVLFRGLQKLDELAESSEAGAPDNVRFLCVDAGDIENIFAPGEIDGIYLNFSDPWPKDRHARRRLTHRGFLEKYHRILKDDGRIEFKTDNKDLFEFSVNEFTEADGWELTYVTRDLHKDAEQMQDNIMTEYEEKFSKLGNKICKLIAVRV